MVPAANLLKKARVNGRAISAFNIHSYEILHAVVEAAIETYSPLIIQTTANSIKNLGLKHIVTMVNNLAENTEVPIVLHLDHGTNLELIAKCLNEGYTSVMIDGSTLPFNENVNLTRKVVELAKSRNVTVEAELGAIGAMNDYILHNYLADPEKCKLFVELTGIDALAPAIGTVHGLYNGEPNIDFGRLESIASKVEIH